MAIKQCEHCGKPVMIPEGVDQRGLEQAIAKVFNSSSFCQQFPALCARVAKIESAMGSHPKPSKEFIETQWENCPECHSDWSRIKREIVDEALRTHHPVLSEELMKHFADCPECREQAEKLGIPLPGEEESFPWVTEEV
ncbi:MAG: hypothetical protein ACTSPB_07130 [Candidatus Thorarchaeota archaeon]